jgi:hypothetical protein
MIKPREGNGQVKIKNNDNLKDVKKTVDKSLQPTKKGNQELILKKPKRPDSNDKKCPNCKKKWLATNGVCPRGGYCDFGQGKKSSLLKR